MRLHQRKVATRGWRWWRTGVGLFYVLSALFNATYTVPRADDAGTFDGYADGAWFGFLAEFMRDVFIPNAVIFITLVIVFEVVVGLLILSQERLVDLGVLASLAWVVAILPFLAWPYLLVNVALVAIQGAVALRRYEHPAWRLSGGIDQRVERHTRVGSR